MSVLWVSEGDEFHDVSTGEWYVYQRGRWLWFRNDETPAPIPQGDQGGGASAPGEGARS